MLSKSFSTQLRKAGQQFRTGVLGDAITETYKDADAAFKLLENACGYGFAPCKVVYDTPENTTFAGGGKDAVDGVTLAVGDRILITAQTASQNNGIYVVTALGAGVDDATWERSVDLNVTAEVALGYKVRVLYGTTYTLTDWIVSVAPAALGTNPLTFVRSFVAAANVLLRTEYNAQTVLVAVADNLPLPVTLGTNTFLGRAAGDIAALAAADARGVLLTSSVAHTAEMLGAGTVGADRLAAGSASEGVNGGDVKFTVAQAAGVLVGATLPVILELYYPNQASGNADWTGLIGKHEIIDFYVKHSAAGDADDTYTLQTAGGVAITNAVKPGAAIGIIGRASLIDPTTAVLANAAGIRIAGVKVGATSAAAHCYVVLLPRA